MSEETKEVEIEITKTAYYTLKCMMTKEEYEKFKEHHKIRNGIAELPVDVNYEIGKAGKTVETPDSFEDELEAYSDWDEE